MHRNLRPPDLALPRAAARHSANLLNLPVLMCSAVITSSVLFICSCLQIQRFRNFRGSAMYLHIKLQSAAGLSM